MTSAVALCCALILDALIGEPQWLWRRVPHPAVLIGRLIRQLDDHLNKGAHQRAKGILATAVLVGTAAIIGTLLSLFGPLAEILIATILLAQKSLISHVAVVADGLRLSVAQGRRAVALIVSRDTAAMDGPAVARSAIESGAENLSDAVVAPAFWFLIGGLPGILIYKAVNTADSMIGYRTARYADFGWAAARLDDVLNWIPARLTAIMIAMSAGVMDQWRQIRADAKLHRSPNAGWPEAAMARAIGVAIAGPRAYDGEMQPFAWVNEDGQRDVGAADIDAALRQMWRAWAVLFFLTAAWAALWTWM